MKKLFMVNKLERCIVWLVRYLEENGATQPKDILAIGNQLGFSRPTIYRAATQLGDRLISTEGAPFTLWKLAD